jgi:hypothetical protein
VRVRQIVPYMSLIRETIKIYILKMWLTARHSQAFDVMYHASQTKVIRALVGANFAKY